MDQNLRSRIQAAAQERGLDPDVLLRFAHAESSLDPNAKAKTSSARGLFQVINKTWKEHGGKDRNDVNEQIRVGADVVASNQQSFKRKFNREPSAAELYAYHVLGPTGAPQLLKADPDSLMSQVVSPEALKANPVWKDKTVGQVLGTYEKKVGSSQTPRASAEQPKPGMKPTNYSFEPLTQMDLENLGPGYQAGMAAMALGDSQDDNEDNIAENAQEAKDDAENSMLADQGSRNVANLDLSYASPFAEEAPVQLAKGGEARKMMAVYRADGSPEYGEVSMGDFSGTVNTGDARKELSNFFKQGWKMPTKEDAKRLAQIPVQGLSNLESAARGSMASEIGGFGDIEAAFRDPRADSQAFPTRSGIQGRKETILPQTQDVLDAMPKKLLPSNDRSEGYEELGTYVGLGPAGYALSKVPAAYRVAAPAVGAAVAKGAEKVKSLNIPEKVQSVVDRIPPRTHRPVDAMEWVRPEAPTTNLQVPEIVRTVEPEAKKIPTSPRTPESHFVSKLDQFTAALPGAVTKGQYLGSLKGKFRDYEILRAEEALAGLDANAKLKPVDITARLRNVTPVENLKTYILEPKGNGAYWHNMDNPHPDKPMGVINLMGAVPEDVMQSSNLAKTAAKAYRDISSGSATPEHYQLLRSYLPNLGLDPKVEQQLIKSLDTTEEAAIRIGQKEIIAKDAINEIRAPMASPKYVPLYKEMSDLSLSHDAVNDKVTNALRTNAANVLRSLGYTVDNVVETIGLTPYNTSAYNQIEKISNDVAKQFKLDLVADKTDIANHFQEVNKDVTKALSSQNKLYEGQHGTLSPESGTPIGFSRFTDVTADIPGLGEKKLMHVAELQSDLFDDAVKKGSNASSLEKDKIEANKIQDKVSEIVYRNKDSGITKDPFKLLSEINQTTNPSNYTSREVQKAELEKLKNQYGLVEKDFVELLKLANRKQHLGIRISGQGSYDIPEAFKGMEHSPQVVQQMLAKNAIIAGIRRGVDGVTFPGSESAQAQIYERLPNNLKQVVKDLGPGFELRPIQTESAKHGTMTNWGVIWDPEAAQRALQEGVRFNKGGSVEKNYDDNRRFL